MIHDNDNDVLTSRKWRWNKWILHQFQNIRAATDNFTAVKIRVASDCIFTPEETWIVTLRYPVTLKWCNVSRFLLFIATLCVVNHGDNPDKTDTS